MDTDVDTKREERVSIRLSHEEWQELKRRAGGLGKISSYVRGLLHGTRPVAPVTYSEGKFHVERELA